VEQLLFLELLLKLSGGLILLLVPLTACRVFGLPKPQSGLWPRLLGCVLVGIAGALYVEGAVDGVRGLGLGGLIAINLIAAMSIFGILIINSAGQNQVGRFILAVLAALLVLLSLIELAYL